MEMRLAIGQRMNIDISGRSEAHCSHYVVNMQGNHGICPAICQPGNNRKNQHVCALRFEVVRRAWGRIEHAAIFESF